MNMINTTHGKHEQAVDTHDGQVVSMSGDTLVTLREGKIHSHIVTADALVTRDGLPYRAEDLKPGGLVRVTTRKDDKHVALGIESVEDD